MLVDVLARDGHVVIDLANTEIALEPREARRFAELIRQTSYRFVTQPRRKPEPKSPGTTAFDNVVLDAVRRAAFGSVSLQDLHHQIVDSAKRLLVEEKIELSHGRLCAKGE